MLQFVLVLSAIFFGIGAFIGLFKKNNPALIGFIILTALSIISTVYLSSPNSFVLLTSVPIPTVRHNRSVDIKTVSDGDEIVRQATTRTVVENQESIASLEEHFERVIERRETAKPDYWTNKVYLCFPDHPEKDSYYTLAFLNPMFADDNTPADLLAGERLKIRPNENDDQIFTIPNDHPGPHPAKSYEFSVENGDRPITAGLRLTLREDLLRKDGYRIVRRTDIEVIAVRE